MRSLGLYWPATTNKESHSWNPRFYFFPLLPSEGIVTPLWYISILTLLMHMYRHIFENFQSNRFSYDFLKNSSVLLPPVFLSYPAFPAAPQFIFSCSIFQFNPLSWCILSAHFICPLSWKVCPISVQQFPDICRYFKCNTHG